MSAQFDAVSTFFLTDLGKDGDDQFTGIFEIFLALLRQDADLPSHENLFVLVDEIRCDEKGVPHPGGQFGLRSLFFNWFLEMTKAELGEEKARCLPGFLPGPVSSYYTLYDPDTKHFHDGRSLPFYLTEQVKEYYSVNAAPSKCRLNPHWMDPLIDRMEKGPVNIVSIAPLDALHDLLARDERNRSEGRIHHRHRVRVMGANPPYSNGDKKLTASPAGLPYNLRSTDEGKVREVFSLIIKSDNMNAVSGTTRAAPRYGDAWLSSTENSGQKQTADLGILSRAFLVLCGKMGSCFLRTMMLSILTAPYGGFWPHDAVIAMLLFLEENDLTTMGLPPLTKEMLFTTLHSVKFDELSVRMVESTGFVKMESDAAAASAEMHSSQNVAMANLKNTKEAATSQKFRGKRTAVLMRDPDHSAEDTKLTEGVFNYNGPIDIQFFISLLHMVSMLALPEKHRREVAERLGLYRRILELKARPAVSGRQGEIDHLWISVVLLELKSQFDLIATKLAPDSDMLSIFRAHPTLKKDGGNPFELAKFSPEQAMCLSCCVRLLISCCDKIRIETVEDRTLILAFIQLIAEYMQTKDKTLPIPTLEELEDAMKVAPASPHSPLTIFLEKWILFLNLKEEDVELVTSLTDLLSRRPASETVGAAAATAGAAAATAGAAGAAAGSLYNTSTVTQQDTSKCNGETLNPLV